MFIGHLERITIEHDPDELFNRGAADDGLDREAVISEYAVSLGIYLADVFGPIRVEVRPVPNSRQTRIRVEADGTSATALESIRAAIETEIDEHYERGDFWVKTM